MEPRITNPVMSVPGAMEALQALSTAAFKAARQAGLPRTTLDLVSLRASQINGCAVCLDMAYRAPEFRRNRPAHVYTRGVAGDAVLHRR